MRDNLTIIKDSYAHGAKGDIPGLLADITPQCTWIEMAGNIYGGTYKGQEAILANVFARINEDWDNFAAVPAEFLDGGDKIVVLGNYSGTSKKTGKNFIARYAHVWTLKDGHIICFEQFTDTAIMHDAAG